MQVAVDQHKCIGSGSCVSLAPEVFDQNDDALVVLLDEHPPAALWDATRQAADVCPARAISCRS